MGAEDTRTRTWLRWTVPLLLGLGLLAVGALFLTARVRPRPQAFYRKGELFLASGNTITAIDHFRRALELDPGHLDAQVGLVRALADRKDFDGAFAELDKAGRMGLGPAQAALERANVYLVRLDHRMRSAGALVEIGLCDDVIARDADPAIRLLQQHADSAERPAAAYSALGNLRMQKSRILALKASLLMEAGRLAERLQRREEAAARDNMVAELVPLMRDVRGEAMDAYVRAMELEPEWAPPRLEIARLALTSYIPQPAQAIAVLEPMVVQRPDDGEARALLLAQAESLLGDHDRALEHIRSVRDQQREQFDLGLYEVQILFEQERWQEAREVSERLLEARPHDIRAAYARGRLLLHEATSAEADQPDRREKAGAAANILQRILAGPDPPSFPQARFALAQALKEAGNREQAMSSFKDTLKALEAGRLTPDVTVVQRNSLRELRYQTCLALARELKDDDRPEAGKYARQAAELFPRRAEALQVAREAYRDEAQQGELLNLILNHAVAIAAAGETERALEICRDELTTAGGKGAVRLVMAQLLVRNGARREAVRVFEELWQEFPDRRHYAYELLELYSALGRTAEARRLSEELLRAEPRDTIALTRLVGVLAVSDDMEAARSMVAHAERELGPGAVRALLLNLSLHEGRIQDAIQLARAQVEALPEQGAAHAVLAELLWSAGRRGEARAAFDKALELAPDLLFAYYRGLLDLEDGRTREAVAVLREAQKRFPNWLLATESLAVALQADGKPVEAVELLEEVLPRQGAAAGGADALRWYLALMHASLGNAETATALNREILVSDLGTRRDRRGFLERLAAADGQVRRNAALAVNLLALFRRTESWQPAMRQVEFLERILPGEPLPSCWRALVLDRWGKHQEAVALWERLVGDHPDLAFARSLLSDSHALHGDIERAVRVREEALLHASPEDAGMIQLRLGELYAIQGRLEAAVSSYEAAIRHRDVAPHACNNLAYLLATRKGDPAAALPLAERARRLAGPTPAILETLGWIHYLKGDAQQAVEYLEKAKAGLPNVATLRYHLGMAYRAAGRRAEARAELEEALSITRTFPDAQEAVKALEAL
ncbi:MAG: tetratricopeptide repeat protein [Candidatus Brocadiae bacterium]|nr:tetratricopeptide repeat protein [Candidatus Brocadiia bacterium]